MRFEASEDPDYLTDNPSRRSPDLTKTQAAIDWAPEVDLRERAAALLRALPRGGLAVRVAVVGCGYVGLVSGVGLASVGHHVVGIEVDRAPPRANRRGLAGLLRAGPRRAAPSPARRGPLPRRLGAVRGCRRRRRPARRADPSRRGRGDRPELPHPGRVRAGGRSSPRHPAGAWWRSEAPWSRAPRRGSWPPPSTATWRWPPTPSSSVRARRSTTSCTPTGW